MDQYNYEQKIHEIIKIVRLFFNMLLNLYPLLDKVECTVTGDFQMDQHFLMSKEFHMRPYI